MIKYVIVTVFVLTIGQSESFTLGPLNIPIPKEVGKGFGGIFRGLGSTVREIGEGLGGGVFNVGNGVGGILSGVTDGLENGLTGIGKGLGNILGGVGSGLGDAVTGDLGGLATGVGGGLVNGLGNVVGKGIGGIAGGAVEGVADGVTGVGLGVGDIAGGVYDGVTVGGGEVVEGVDDLAEGITYSAYQGGNEVITTLLSPVLQACESLKNMMGVSYDKLDDTDKAPDFSNLTIRFISRDYNQTYKLETVATDILEAPFFNSSQKLYLFIHGWKTDPSQRSFRTIKNALFASGNNNVIALDSSEYLDNMLYLRSSTYVRFIGKKIGQVLINLYNGGMSPENIHVIGHSLGAHISGFAGKLFRNQTGVNLSRISGLDPAGPCFTELATELTLSKTDADFVDVIHSNARFLGILRPVGHLDFYPNGGKSQKGCVSITCDHGRAVELYAESITNPQAFPAFKCTGWRQFTRNECGSEEHIYMGFPASPSDANGTYYLMTESSSPYSLGEKGLRF